MSSTAASSLNPSHEELLVIAHSGEEAFMPATGENQVDLPHKFLSLAPTTSGSYPISPRAKAEAVATATLPPTQSQVSDPSAATGNPALEESLHKESRSSSTSSNGSVGQNGRFLKLGPVHFGEDKDGKGDWSEDAITV